MKILLVLFAAITLSFSSFAQSTLKITVKDSITAKSLAGATLFINTLNKTSVTDKSGTANFTSLPEGKYLIEVRFVGYTTKRDSVLVSDTTSVSYLLSEKEGEELDEVVISSTRSSRSIANIPTRVETIIGEELDEKSVMQPGNIRMLLTESTGIQTQQTSQVSGSASIRIQGLDGKYTQLLQDGFPLYSGFADGLSILQIPPLNLKRVEVIKGSASTLYGGGAIAGLVNLITKEPTEKPELSFLVNANQTGALDISSYYSERYKKTGLAVYAGSNLQRAFDNNKDQFSDIPQSTRYTFDPKFFYYPDKNTSLSIGLITGFEQRTGGNLSTIKDESTLGFFERNNSSRYSTQAKFQKIINETQILTLKNSIGYFNRIIDRPSYNFEGKQLSSFTEFNYLIPGERSEWNVGANYVSDAFKQVNASFSKLDYSSSVFGLFAQNNYSVTQNVIVEAGLRLDLSDQKDVFLLPRLSTLFKFSPDLTARIGGGLGYKTPTIFSEESEEQAFQNIEPIDFNIIKPEKSYGLNGDINYKTTLGDDFSFSINQMFFYTRLRNPIILRSDASDQSFSFVNAKGYLSSKGFETNVRLKYDDFSGYFGYTFIDANRRFNNTSKVNPLTARSRINANIMYELDEKLRISYEAFYTGRQYLSSGEKTKDFWVMGVSAERRFDKFSLFINMENFMDTRQTRWEPSYTGSPNNPLFNEIYTPSDGFILNGGFKLKF